MPMRYLLEELRQNIQSNDLMKARVVLAQLGAAEPAIQQRVLFELSRCEGHFAIPLLGHVLANMADLAVPQQSVRDVLCDKILDAPEEFIKLLENPELRNKSPLIELAGSMQLEAAVPCLLTLLARETDQELLCDLLKALGTIGHPNAIEAFVDYLYADTRALVSTAVWALAQCGRPEVVEPLASRMGSDSKLDRLILDALASMNTELALEKLADILDSPQAAARNHAKQVLQSLGARAIPVLSRCLLADHDDMVIHALNTLGAIGDAEAVPPIRRLLHREPQDANVRFAAYEALGMLPLHKAAFVLAEGLEDGVEDVRIAAAKAIERHHNDIIIAGISNLVQPQDAMAHRTIQALLHGKAEQLILSLIENAVFRSIALDYLRTQVHPELRIYYEMLLHQHGYSAYAASLKVASKASPISDDLIIYAVDDSRMILSIYKKMLYQLGFEVQLFEFPAAALEQMRQTKPHIVFTDLNMPELTGIDLTEQLRTWYAKDALPIVMVTTQSEGQDHAAAYAAGVTAILPKPFSAEHLAQMIAQHVRKE